MNNFDSVAPFYDRLSKIIFGSAIKRAQTTYLGTIPQGANVLIVGGGTGWILSELFAVNSTCKVWYIDASSSMIQLAKEEAGESKHQVVFIHGTEDSMPAEVSFDAVITNFYLDLFTNASCNDVIRKISSAIHAKSVWLISDFVNTTWWHGAMLRMMYLFFKLMSGIEANSLCDWKKLMEQNGFQEEQSKKFFRKFIKTAAFRLTG